MDDRRRPDRFDLRLVGLVAVALELLALAIMTAIADAWTR